jgi:predicted nucleic acid-binding protein
VLYFLASFQNSRPRRFRLKKARSLVLVDSSAWVFALRKDGIEHIRRRVGELLDQDRLAICALVACELLGGAKTPKDFDRLAREFAGPHDLAIDDEVWKRAARVNFELARAGQAIPAAACVIAATALCHDVILAHCDGHFDRVARTTGLRVESYVHLAGRFGRGRT